MPKPRSHETEQHFMSRCIPQLMAEGKPNDQAVAICASLWSDKNNININKKENSMLLPQTVTKVYKSEIKSFNDVDLILTHFISTEQEDRSKDIVLADGIRFDGVPVVLKQHGQDPVQGMEPIAKPISLSVGTNSKGIKGVVATTQYYDGSKLTPPDNTGRRLYEKAKEGYMPYWSIGFRIEDGIPRQGGGVEIRKSVVYEYSQVAVPDNVGAEVIKSIESGEPLEKVSNEFITFGNKPEPTTPIVAPTAVTAPTTITSTQTSLKSIAERIGLELPMRSIYIIWEGFVSELFNTSKEKVTDAILELSMLLEVYAKQIVEYVNPMNEEEKSILLKSLLADKKDFDADRAPSKPVSVPSEPVVPPVVNTSIAIPASEKVILKFSLPVAEEPKVPTIKIDPVEFSKLIRNSIRASLTDAITKMRGKL